MKTCAALAVGQLRSSPPEVFCKKGVLRNFAQFTGKHLCQSLFLSKVGGLRPAFFNVVSEAAITGVL